VIGRRDAEYLPSLAFSFAKAFHANDPRIGSGRGQPDLVIQSRAYQMVATKLIEGTEFRILLEHVTSSQELAEIDPDTGLQQALGPSLNRYITVSALRRGPFGFLQASYSQANATDLALHQPVPEAPRLIIDAVGELDHLPWGVQAQSEFAYVGEKPLGDGFHAVPVHEIRLSLQKVFGDGKWLASINGQFANGATGQTWRRLRCRERRARWNASSAFRFAPTAAFSWSTSSGLADNHPQRTLERMATVLHHTYLRLRAPP
jgi:hypothetical protein